ncbi:MAG TPA: cytochrome C oxidase subunit IV family protein [Pirellulales bacterium]|jgi:caa(3)-type oxidase subunit IV|nr:cytochrome C oxidase subunit IV family protein [Pirellulales bacterium]
MSEPTHHAHAAAHAPHPSVAALVANFIALMVLLAATIAIAEIDLGRGNFIAATAIAATKTTLIMVIFMNLRHSKPLTRLVACAGFFWLAIMFALSFSDYLSRGWLAVSGG